MKTRTPPQIPSQAVPGARTTVVIVDDVSDIRDLLRIQLARRPRLQIVGEAADGVDALWLCADLEPDIVILDLLMPRMDGAQAATHIKLVSPKTKVVLHSSVGELRTQPSPEHLLADEYVVKGGGRDMMLAALDRIVAALQEA